MHAQKNGAKKGRAFGRPRPLSSQSGHCGHPNAPWSEGRAFDAPMPDWKLANGILNLAANSDDRVIQHLANAGSSTRTERNCDCPDDTSRNDDVLERHHAGGILAQLL